MQPYFFPYIGYFQLITAVDKFVVYDDVNYIKGGWINRNKILVDNQESLFTLPLNNSSSFAKINSIKVNQKLFPAWKKKFLKSLTQSYQNASNFKEVFQLIEKILEIDNEEVTISALSVKAIKRIAIYLKIDTEIIDTSSIFNNNHLKAQDRVLDICKQLNCTSYVNPIGGTVLYNKVAFKSQNIDLSFLKSNEVLYKQFNKDFIPWLSVIDVLMFNRDEELGLILNKYELV